CLSVVDFVESFEDRTSLRRALLDAVSFCQNTTEVALYLSSLGQLREQANPKLIAEVLSSAKIVADHKASLASFLLTLEAIAKKRQQSCFEEFLMATRVVAEFFKSPEDFFTTTRHLCDCEGFQDWAEYFKLVKIIKDQDLDTQKNVFEAIRHSAQYFQTSNSFKGIFRTLSEIPQHSGAFAYGQLDSKKWLIEEAIKCWGTKWGTVFVLAGWIGLLPRMIWDQKIQATKIRSFDIDESANKASELLNQVEVQTDWQYKSSTQDITKMSYPTLYNVQRKDGTFCELADHPDIIINTSCEHIADIKSWFAQIPKGTKVILQSNDGFHIDEHVACFKTLAEFEKAIQLSKVEYRGEKALPEFNRFMLIGIK
ncbi:hypothetical protein K2X05_14945, partial [bacterium]|nr:hypothetical protein [bacterium]